MNRTRIIATSTAGVGLAAIGIALAAPAFATEPLGTLRPVDGKTTVLEWVVPAGDTPWPQTPWDGSCGAGTIQRDVYPYATDADRARTDALAADGLLKEGEDYGWAKQWEYVDAPDCAPEPSPATTAPAPTPTTPTEEPSSSPSPTAPAPEPTAPATAPTPGPSTSPSSGPTSPAEQPAVPSESPSPSLPSLAAPTSASPSPVSASPVAKAAAVTPSTAPSSDALAYTGSDDTGLIVGGTAAIAAGLGLLVGHAIGYGKGRKLRRATR